MRAVLLSACLLLSGCDLYDNSTRTMSEHSLLKSCWKTGLSFSDALNHIRTRTDLAARQNWWGDDEAICVDQEQLLWVIPGDGAAQITGKEIMAQDWEVWIIK